MILQNKDLARIAPLVKDAAAWDAFMTMLGYEEAKALKRLAGKPEMEELIRIAAVYSFIQQLKEIRTVMINLESELRHANK